LVDLLNQFRERQAEILEEIRALVEMESPTLDRDATTAVTTFLVPEFELVGATVKLYPTENGSHLVAHIPFNAPAAASPLMMLGHVDTVWPLGTLETMPFRIEENRAYGPAVFDMKSNVVLMLEALRVIASQGLRMSHPVTVFLSCDEESGSASSRSLIEAEARSCAAVLVLEPPLPGGIVKTERKGIAAFEIKTHGIPAHAGLEPEKGVSAIVEMAHQILKLQEMVDLPAGISINTGVIKGGTYSNVVAAEASIEVDVRFPKLAEGKRISDKIHQLEPVLSGSRVEVIGGLNRPPLERTADVIVLFEKAKGIAAELDFELKEGSVGGGSDGNFTAALGVPTLDGLGVDGAGAHAKHEHILIDDIPRRAALLVGLLTSL
jgi:glutamate carboxypeptidase